MKFGPQHATYGEEYIVRHMEKDTPKDLEGLGHSQLMLVQRPSIST